MHKTKHNKLEHNVNSLRVACVQINARHDVQANLAKIAVQLAEAERANVDVVLLPENFAQMPLSSATRHFEVWQPESPDSSAPVQSFLQNAAQQYKLTIIAGAMPIKAAHTAAKPFSRCIVVNARGAFVAFYDKLHLFDVETEVASYRESDEFAVGDLSQLASEPPSNLLAMPISVATDDSVACGIGLTICYDLRFPEMFRQLLNAGATAFTVPAAFTYETGKQHWQVLLQARAIENQSYVIAAGQCGEHPTSASQQGKQKPRRTWGHSMVVAPSGEIIATLAEEEALLIADIDLIKQQRERLRFPVTKHQRCN